MSLLRNKYSNISDENLMLLIQQGEIPAFNEVYQRYSQRILYYFFRMVNGNEESAQDLLQDLFLKVIQYPKDSAPVLNFSSWIFTAAHNMCKNEYRNKKVREIFDLTYDLDSFEKNESSRIPDSEKMLDNKLFEDAVMHELQKMETAQRSTFLLKYQENFTIKEISRMLECSEGTIKSRLFYTTQKLASRLKDFNPNFIEVQT